jgi:osmoprotectant transport system permease protein
VIAPLAQEPVIPEFERASECIRENRQFCFDWFVDNFDREYAPRLVEHIELTAIAVGIGFAIAFTAALIAYSRGWFETPFALLAALLYTIPSLAFFQLMVPITGLGRTSAEIALVSYTLLILFRNTLTGLREVPEDARVAARAMISLATVAAFIGVGGLGQPIFNAIQSGFKTEFVAAGLLAVLLALVADALLVLVQRLLTPWARARRV